MGNIFENLDNIFAEKRKGNKDILDEYKNTGYGKDSAQNPLGILSNIVRGGIGFGKIFTGDASGAADVGAGVGGIFDSAGRQKTVNNFTGESVTDAPSDAYSKMGEGLGGAMTKDDIDPVTGVKKKKMFWETQS